MMTHEKKQVLIKDMQSHKTDTGSVPVQVTVLTESIKELTEHLKVAKKDFSARRSLLQKVGRRRRLLNYLAEKDSQAYLKLIKTLGLRK